jgi:hypothetical protein
MAGLNLKNLATFQPRSNPSNKHVGRFAGKFDKKSGTAPNV